MKVFRVSTLVAFSLAVASGAGLFVISQRVQRAEHHLAALEKDKAGEEDSIRVLRAEWDYLNRPDRLEALAHDGVLGGWQVPATYDDGRLLREATHAQGLEGILSKRRTARYECGVRSRAWLKFPHRFRASYVVGGWRPQVDTADRLAALLVGEPTAEGLLYRGRVGSGITGRHSQLLRELLTARASSPFADEVPREDLPGTRWTEPLIVVEVETHGIGTGLASGGRLRQPSYQGVRADLTPEDLL